MTADPTAHESAPTYNAAGIGSSDLFSELVLMVDVFCASIETGVLPTHGSPCHRRARWIVEASGQKPKRLRRRLPPNYYFRQK